jgi:tRNA (guanine9-N1)-methyltransferase
MSLNAVADDDDMNKKSLAAASSTPSSAASTSGASALSTEASGPTLDPDLFSTEKEVKSRQFWLRRRAVQRERAKQKRSEETPEEREQRIELERVKRQRNDRWKQLSVEELGFSTPELCVDLSWHTELTSKELRSLAKQLSYVYASLKKAERPLYVHLTSLEGVVLKALKRDMAFDQWRVLKHERAYLDVFERERIVYLSPDSPNVLRELDDDKVYVIGGIVDRDRMKGSSQKRAEELGVSTARLPIHEPDLFPDGRKFPHKSLNVNAVAEILFSYAHCRSWAEALQPHLPTRRGFRKGESAKGKEKQDVDAKEKQDVACAAAEKQTIDAQDCIDDNE